MTSEADVMPLVDEMMRALVSSPQLARLVPLAAQNLARAAGLWRATVFVFDGRGARLAGTTRTAEGDPDPQLWTVMRREQTSIPAIRDVLRDPKTLVFHEPETAPQLGTGDWPERFGARSVIVAPLKTGSRVSGVVVLDDPGRGAATRVSMDAVEHVAGVCAAAFDLSGVLRRERALRTRRELVLDTVGAATGALNVASVLHEVAAGVQRATDDDVVVGVALDEDQPSLVGIAGDESRAQLVVDAFKGSNVASWLDDVAELDLNQVRFEALAATGYSRGLAAPLRHSGKDLGWILSVGSRPGGYGVDVRKAVSAISVHTALSLHTLALLQGERAAVDRLAELDRLKTAFVAAVSHELRTPLTAILGYSEILGEEVEDPAAKRHIADLRRESAVLEALVGNLLDTSRLEAGLLRLNVHPVDLAALAEEAVDVVSRGYEEHVISLHRPVGSVPVTADGVRMRQVLINLIDNAAKYSPADSAIDVTVFTPESEDGVEAVQIAVDDHGPGIPRRDRDVVFERFHRLRDHSFQPGTGIGLYIVKALVDAHGGSIEISDGPDGDGTRFLIDIPKESVPS